MSAFVDQELDELVDAPAETAPVEWRTDKGGRQYIPAPNRRGRINRRGDETVSEALRRDSEPRQRRPRAKTPKPPPPPQKIELVELERLLAETFKAPAIPAAAIGDVWTADHFTNTGPFLARNLVVAAEHNPWLRKKLESAASGGDAAMRLIALVPLCGAMFLYAVPPLVYWLNLPVPDKAREMMQIPDRRARNGSHTPSAETAQAA